MKEPPHQRAVKIAGYGIAGLLAGGALLDSYGNSLSLISDRIAVVGSIVLAVALFAAHVWLLFRPMEWVVKGQGTKLTGLGLGTVAFTGGLIGLLWLPHLLKPTDRETVDWARLLYSGRSMTVDVGDLPDHAAGSLLVEGGAYMVRFQRDPCIWEGSGPSKVPGTHDIAAKPLNRAGPSVKPYLSKDSSGSATSDCNSPLDHRIVILGLDADFDRRGVVSFGGKQHKIGTIRVP